MSTASDTLLVRNMRKRRARILAEARGLLGHGGFEALSLRELARLAEVTVPTIYNLIGNKEAVLLALGADVVTEIEARMHGVRDNEPLAQVAGLVEQSTALFAEDEGFYRSAFLAVEWLEQGRQHHEDATRIFAWAEALAIEGIQACLAARLMHGRIPASHMGELIMRSYRTGCRAWAFGHCDLHEFRSTALIDLYIALAADAVETFRQQLARKISRLSANTARPARTRSSTLLQRGETR